MTLKADDPRHGTWNGYGNLRCRCDACKDARRAYMREYIITHPDHAEKNRQRVRDWRTRRKAGLQ